MNDAIAHAKQILKPTNDMFGVRCAMFDLAATPPGGVISVSLDEGDARGWRVAFAVLIPAGYSCKTQQHLLSCFAAERPIKT